MKAKNRILFSFFILSVAVLVCFFPTSILADDNPISSIHIESNNPYDSTVARVGDVIRITYTQNPNYDGFNGFYSLAATMLFAPNGTFDNGWGAEDVLDSCNYADLGTTKNVCVYEFPVLDTSDTDFFYNPQDGLFQFAANTNYGLLVGSTDGSSVTIDRTLPSTTISTPSSNAEVDGTFSVTGACTNGLSVNFSGTGFTPSTASTSCTGGTYTSPAFTTIGTNVNFVAKQTTAVGNTKTVTRKFLAPAPAYAVTKNWDFGTPSDYTYDNTKVTVSSGVAGFQKANVTDDTHWYKSTDNPFIEPTQPWEGTLVFEPAVIYEDGIFKMWYSGGSANCSIGYATSTDGRNWTKPFDHPVIGSGYGGIDGPACRVSITKHNGVYYLTFVDGIGIGGEEVYLLTSTDGVTFTNPRIILRTSAPDLGIANTYTFVDDDGTWYLFYEYKIESSFTWSINYASGPDLDHLFRHFPTPLQSLSLNGAYGGPVLKKIGNKYHIWYHASTNNQTLPTHVYHAISDDLKNWRPVPGPTIDITQPSWETDQTADPFIVEANGKLYMFYDGDDNSGQTVISYIGFVEFDGTFEDFAMIENQFIVPKNSQNQPFTKLYGFTETATKGAHTETRYQVSIDGGTTWKYWNGSAWTSAGTLDGSSALEINDNIRSLDSLGNGGVFTYKAVLYSEGNTVSLDSVSLSYSYTSAPTALTVTTTTSDASLSWTAPSESTAPVTDYLIEYKQSSSGTWNTFTHTPSTTPSITVTGLASGTSYDFRVSAVTSEGASDASSVATATTATVVSGGSAVVFLPSWEQKSTPPITTNTSSETTTCQPLLTSAIRSGTINDPNTVKTLQKFLNDNEGASLALDGTYDTDDILAVKKFQEKYQSEILAPWGLAQGTGTVSITTLAKINALHCGQTTSCPYFTGYIKAGESGPEVSKVKSFLNMIDATLKLDTSSQIADTSFIAAVSKFQLRYKDFILKPWGLSRPTGYWYKTTSAKANEFMGCKS